MTFWCMIVFTNSVTPIYLASGCNLQLQTWNIGSNITSTTLVKASLHWHYASVEQKIIQPNKHMQTADEKKFSMKIYWTSLHFVLLVVQFSLGITIVNRPKQYNTSLCISYQASLGFWYGYTYHTSQQKLSYLAFVTQFYTKTPTNRHMQTLLGA